MIMKLFHRAKARVLLTLANWALAKMPAQPSTRVEPQPAPSLAAPKWQAMAGNHLELGSTGYIIKMQPGRGRATFRLTDPEGDAIGNSEDLAMLKAYAEQRAQFRQEFTAATNPAVTSLLQLFMGRGQP